MVGHFLYDIARGWAHEPGEIMLMVAILSWNNDLVIQQARSIQDIKNMRARFDNPNTNFIIHDSNFLCPIKFDNCTRQLMEDEQIEWLRTEVYPAPEEEGLMERVNGRLKFKKRTA
jgi:hypothetical protein